MFKALMMAGISAAVMVGGTVSLATATAAPAAASGVLPECISMWETDRVIACAFRDQQQCRQWVEDGKILGYRESAAGCNWNEAGSHRPEWDNPEGFVGGRIK
ncbi:hypothetical protein ACFYV7_20095 [Nocardia suismassiliense]|uniref:DUF3551 domain-containing protein n=1 Tax=Nocardia suismassiliense TaxID=2077092 RepID=A0ABW6QV32_9NOCA